MPTDQFGHPYSGGGGGGPNNETHLWVMGTGSTTPPAAIVDNVRTKGKGSSDVPVIPFIGGRTVDGTDYRRTLGVERHRWELSFLALDPGDATDAAPADRLNWYGYLGLFAFFSVVGGMAGVFRYYDSAGDEFRVSFDEGLERIRDQDSFTKRGPLVIREVSG